MDLTDQMEEKRQERAQKMAELQGRDPVGVPVDQYGLYTYQVVDGVLDCRILTASGATAARCQEFGQKMKDVAAAEGQSELNFMVVRVEELPAT